MYLEDIVKEPTINLQKYLSELIDELGLAFNLPTIKEIDGTYYDDKVYELQILVEAIEDELETRYFENSLI